MPRVMTNQPSLKIEPSSEPFNFLDCSKVDPGRILRDLQVNIGNDVVPVDFHVMDIKIARLKFFSTAWESLYG